MLKRNKIMLLLGAIGFGAHALATSESSTTEATPFYEDDVQFTQPAEGADNGWGWATSTQVSSLSCDTDCDDTIVIEPPSDVAPSVPKSIAIMRTGESGSVTVQWRGGSAGQGTGFRYELYKQYKATDDGQNDTDTDTTDTQASSSSSTPQQVYSGSSLIRVQNPGSDTTVRYYVRACNSAGCSPYATSSYYAINATYDSGGSVTKALESMRTSSSSGVLARTTQSEQDTALAALSKGFDAIKGEVYGNSCWNVTGDAQIDSVQYINDQKYSFSKVDTYESLASTLDVKRSGGGSISFGGFSIGGSGSSALYSETSKVTESSVIVASFVDKQNRYQAVQADDLGMKSTYENHLISGYDLEFRKACGDKFIDTVTTGRKILFTIRVESISESYSEIKSKTLELKASLESYSADGNFSSSEASSLATEFKGYTFQIIGTQTGGSDPANLLRLNSITEFMTVLTNFANSNQNDLVNIESTERDYPIPAALAGQSHYNVFTDYTVFRDKLQTWGRLDSQLERRCWMLDLNNVNSDAVGQIEDAMGDEFFQGNVSQRDLCDASKDMLDRFVNYCANQGEWDKCQAPNASSCIDAVNGGLCMQRPELISFKGFKLEEKRLDVSRGGCFIGPCYESKSVQQCFSTASTIPDFSRKAVISSSHQPTPVDGLVVTIDRSWNVKSASNSISKVNDKFCLNAYAKIYGKGGWGSGGRYESNNQMFGFETRSLGYVF
jgi:hypothetical protein